MKIIIIDIETTGFLNKGGRIVEIGIVEVDLKTGQKAIIYDKLVKEKFLTKKILENAWIVSNSDLIVDDVMAAESEEIIYPEVQEIINKYTEGATAYNNRFDFDFLESRGIKFIKKLPCPMLLSTDICKLPNQNGFAGYKWPKVEEAYDHFFPDNDYKEKHRGADDAFHEADIVVELYKRGIFKLY